MRYMHLAADFLPGEVLGLEAEDVYLCVGVAHVAHNTPVLHLVHVVSRHHVLVARRGDHNIHLGTTISILERIGTDPKFQFDLEQALEVPY